MSAWSALPGHVSTQNYAQVRYCVLSPYVGSPTSSSSLLIRILPISTTAFVSVSATANSRPLDLNHLTILHIVFCAFALRLSAVGPALRRRPPSQPHPTFTVSILCQSTVVTTWDPKWIPAERHMSPRSVTYLPSGTSIFKVWLLLLLDKG